jgi:peptidoglycan hydrolase-like amidase
MSRAATAPLEEEVNRLDGQVKAIQVKISAAVEKQKVLEKGIKTREERLASQYSLLSVKMREFYKRLRSQSTLTMVLSAAGSGSLGRELAYRSQVNDQDKQLIVELSKEIIQIEQDKVNLEKENKRLATLQVDLDAQADKLRATVTEAKTYQASLSSKIAQLSSLQKSVLSEKQETFQTTVGDVPLADDPNSRPDYNPGFSPAFAVFSFGAPHFKGMSQYGAYGRAKAGHSAEEILRAYYGGIEIKKDYSTDIQINVSGFGKVDIETYAKRIYEMPNSWGDNGGFEALKAQAVAARSYALAYTNNGVGTICATESCQVYKNANKGGKWEEAVNATRGWVLIAGGKPFSAWYASTSGGYQQSYSNNGHSTPGFWDTPSGRGGWTGQAFEKQAGSPWFYKGWYKSRSGDACGRSHPWLTAEEMADIVNAWVVLFKGGGDSSRVTPIGSCWGGNPYSLSDLQGVGGYNKVTGVSVTYSDGGWTSSVRLETNKGTVEISGADFKKAFNLRAPGRVAVKSGLFNIEKK